MAKQKSILKVEGTLDGLTFYKSIDGHMVRTKGGVSKNRIMNDPSFVRTRENIAEFGSTAQAGKLIRSSIGTMLNRAKDPRMSSRMMRILSSIKNNDLTSERGARLVANGIQQPTSKTLLRGFDFNNRAGLQTVLHAPFTVLSTDGSVNFVDLIPLDQINFPEGATHVSFRSAFIGIDFTQNNFETYYSPYEVVPLHMTPSTFTLVPTGVPTFTDAQFILLLIEFSQEINGVSYALKNDAFNVLNIVAVL